MMAPMYDTNASGASAVTAPPTWEDKSRGTRTRVALWLLQEVGVGSVFTKSMLRTAFPGVEQVDRRMRDLRASGWRIDTAKQDPTLQLDELRFVEQGEPVWQPGQGNGRKLNARERKAVLARDRFCCVVCGIAAGEPFPEDPLRRAQLSVSKQGDADSEGAYVTLCDMCRRSQAAPSIEEAFALIERLSAVERKALQAWLSAGRRQRGQLDLAWAVASRLSPEGQSAVIADLDGLGPVTGPE